MWVEHGHLTIEDGIGERVRNRFSKVRHGIQRLVVIGSDGMVSLAALRWLADQNASFVMLERDGSVLLTTGPVQPSDARLRRAQALAHNSGAAVKIVRELVARKLEGQEQIARTKLNNAAAADSILRYRVALAETENISEIRHIESQAALAYWSAWRTVAVMFPKNDLRRVPEHWRTFGSRHSPLTGSPRLAVNPASAILNYLYAVLESETRLAIAVLGLDPGMGVMHVDSLSRDSFACDLMEAVRHQVDAYLLDWILREPLRRDWFFEERDGNCRLMGSFAVRLTETASTWARAIAPVAEWVARTLSLGVKKQVRSGFPATRLTQSLRSEARPIPAKSQVEKALKPERICRICGEPLKRGQLYCKSCALPAAKERFGDVARLGRIAAHTPEAGTRRTKTRLRHAAAIKAWDPTALPGWLTEQAYREKIQPRLKSLTVPAVMRALGISQPYATDIRAGKRRPHPRHWHSLAELLGVSQND